MDLSILYFKGSQVKISKFWYIAVPELKIVFILANSEWKGLTTFVRDIYM